jgi:cell division protein FtsW
MKRWFDRTIPHLIFFFTTCLVLFGLVMVYSSSAFHDYRRITQRQWEPAIEAAVKCALEGSSRVGNKESMMGVNVATTVKGNAVTAVSESQIPTLEMLCERAAQRRTKMLSTFLKQMCWVVLGFCAMGLVVLVDYPLWGKWVIWILLIVLVLQACLFIIPEKKNLPIQSCTVNGSRSWLQVFGLRLQPSEMAKLALVMFTSWFFSRKVSKGQISFSSLLPGIPILMVSIGMILCESDKGVALHICICLLLLWLLVIGKITQVLIIGGITGLVVSILIFNSPEALERIQSFLGTDSFQLFHAKEAFSRGGWFGRGLGDSDAAISAYVFGAHTDFILTIVGEELGFAITSLLVLVYLSLGLVGLRIAANCMDPFGSILALGITLLIGTQAFLNMAVATGLAPTTGFTLPLLSYGGSSLTWTMIAIGILMNISRSNHSQLLLNRNRIKPDPFGRGGVMS